MNDEIKVFNIVIRAKWINFIKWLHYVSQFDLPQYNHQENKIFHLINYSFSNLEREHGNYAQFFIDLILSIKIDNELEDEGDKSVGYLDLRDLSEDDIQIIGICETFEFVFLIETIYKEISIAWEIIRFEELHDQIKFLSIRRYLPKTEETREKWKQAYAIYVDRHEKYKEEVLDGRSKKASPSLSDLKIAILNDMDYDIDEKTIRNIIKVGDADLLE